MRPVTRTSQARRRWWPGVARAGLLVTLLGSTACEDENLAPPVCPSAKVAALEGYVRAGGVGIEAQIHLRGIEPPDIGSFETWSDSTGWYHLDLPADTYQISIWSASGMSVYSTSRDTVCVSAGTRRFDFLHGRVTVRVATPAFFEGYRFRCVLDPVTPRAGNVWLADVATNGRVEFEAPIVAPGVYCFRLSVDDGGECWLPDAADQRWAQQVVVGVDRPRIYETALEHAAAITGHVRGSWQQVRRGSPSIVARTRYGESVGQATAADDGSFTLGLLLAAPVQLQVELDDLVQWIGGDSPTTATVFAPQPGEVVQGADLVESGMLCQLEGPGFITGVDARLQVRDEAGRTVGESRAWTNPFPISNLHAGRYFLFVYGYCEYGAGPWASQWYDGADSLAAATPIDLPEGALVPVTVRLSPGGAIEGRVLTATGELPDMIAVAAFDRYGSALCDGSYRGFQGGTFSLQGLGNGDYTLGVLASSVTWWYPGTARFDSATVIQIRNHAIIRGLEWRLPPEPPGRARP